MPHPLRKQGSEQRTPPQEDKLASESTAALASLHGVPLDLFRTSAQLPQKPLCLGPLATTVGPSLSLFSGLWSMLSGGLVILTCIFWLS